MIENGTSRQRIDRSDSRQIWCWVLENLILESGRHVDRQRVRQALREAEEAFSPLDGDEWWRTLSEACESLGFKTKVVDATPRQTMGMAQNGAMVCWRTPQPDFPCVALCPSTRSQVRVLFPLDETSKSMSLRKLRKVLGRPSRNSTVRCVVLQPYEKLGVAASDETEPFARLRNLLRPEWSDIWSVLAFALIAGLLTLATPIAVESLVNTVAFGTLLQPVLILAIILFAFLGLQGLVRALQTYIVEIIQRRMFARVAADLAYRLPRARAESFDGRYAPELVNRFFDVVTLQKVSAQILLDGVTLLLSTLVGMAVIAFYHPWLLGFDLVLLALIGFTIFVLGRGAVHSSVVESKKKYLMAAWLQDLSRCPTAFKADGGAEFALERTDQILDTYLRARQLHFRILFRQIIFALFLQATASTVLLGLGGWLVIEGELTLGQLVASELIVTVIVGSFAKLGKHMESFYDLLASVDKLGQLFDVPIERTDGLLTFGTGGPAAVKLRHVFYGYTGRKPLFEDLSFEIEPGSRVALTGTPGSGKSTLIDLILAQRSPTLGNLLIDGVDPRELRADVIRHAVAIARHAEIFEGTVAENIILGRPGITRHEAQKVIAELGFYDAIQALPEAFDTRLTSAGRPLSDTQLQLLILARALVGRPRLLLLDGVLDELPDDVQDRVLATLDARRSELTTIIATGRESVKSWCDSELNLSQPRETALAAFNAEPHIPTRDTWDQSETD